MIKSIIFSIISFVVAALILSLFAWGAYLNSELKATRDELSTTVENLELESRKSDELGVELNRTTKELTAANTTISDLKTTEYELVYMGDFKITYYCDSEYEHICGYGDVGGAVKGQHIDVLVQNHSEALDFGIEHEEVWLLVKKGDLTIQN